MLAMVLRLAQTAPNVDLRPLTAAAFEIVIAESEDGRCKEAVDHVLASYILLRSSDNGGVYHPTGQRFTDMLQTWST